MGFTQNHSHNTAQSEIKYIENKGQWETDVLFKTCANSGYVFLEQDGFTFAQYSQEDIKKRGQLYHDNRDSLKFHNIHAHSWKVTFENSNNSAKVIGEDKKPEYNNYFIGNESSKWAGNVGIFNKVIYQGLYEGIDLKVYNEGHNFKYDFIVQPNVDPSSIALRYDGLDNILIEDDNLVLKTSIGDFQEMKPFAYQIVNGKNIEVKCEYRLIKNSVKFHFPEGYNHQLPLIIDPVLVASTLSGSSGFEDNYGHAATYDNQGNIYSGAINFGGGYPSTIGSFQINFTGGYSDIVISKFSPDGSSLMYATYLGGSSEDFPHSLIVNDNNELYVFGTTASIDYPCAAGAYDNTFGGSTDIIVTHFNANGTALVGSTYVGGNGIDGNNILTSNYGDGYRGEIILDATGACYISTCAGLGFPTTSGAYQTAFGGGNQDAVFFKMNSNLSSLIWSTYLGGTGDDSGFGLRLDANGDVYGCGGTDGNFLNANGYQTTNQGGIDGFVVKITNNGSSIPNSTYLGNAGDDVLFFIDIDDLGRINVYGHNLAYGVPGNFIATPGAYNVAGSGQHIACFNTALSSLEFLSLVGGGNPGEFIPIAFTVDVCGSIYFSGHSASFGLPTTPNAILTAGGFYLGALTANATSLSFSTYFTGDHVDGGTSRFDPQGTIYQGVCSGGGFSTTANAYSTNQAGSWDIGVFKINFEMQGVIAVASVSPNASGCAPFTVNFDNNSTGAISYIWNFDDGSSTTSIAEPTHTFVNPGVYDVMLVAINNQSCNSGDTTYLQITVVDAPTVNLGPDTTFCQGSITLNAGSLSPYLWSTGATSQTINVSTSGTYWVNVGNQGCLGSDTIQVTIDALAVNLGPDVVFCNTAAVFPIVLDAGVPNASYLWSTGDTDQTLVVNSAGTYSVTVDNGVCTGTDVMNIAVISGSVSFSVDDTVGCAPVVTHFSSDISNSGNVTNYSWDFGDGGTSSVANPTHGYGVSGVYTVMLTVTTAEGCQFTYSRVINIIVTPQPTANFSFQPSSPELDENVYLINQSQDATAYTWWLNGTNIGSSTNSSFIYNEEGAYVITLIATNDLCVDTFRISIHLVEDLIYYVPNTFTPDNDEFNQQFIPVFTSGFDPTEYRFMIFNRWGEMVFESFDSTIGWDGTYAERKVQDGTYTWKIVFKTKYSGDRKVVVGHLNLLR